MRKVIQKPVRDLIRQLSKEFNIPYGTAEEIIDSQFKFLKHAIGQGVKGDYSTFETVLLRRLGTFEASEAKIDHMTSKYLKKQSDGEGQ